jgi:thiol-disulfide isomerase/thioredoxin
LGDYKGKVVLLNFWATWCAPCVKEMPSLDKLQAEMGKDKFVVIPLSLDGPSKPKVAPFYKDKNLANLGIYFDKSKKVQQALDVSVLPTSILIDAQGREIGRLQGDADWDKPESIALMKAAVG